MWIDRFLDAAQSGPTHLGRTEVACLVVEAIRRGDKDLRHYELHAFAVMPNHVHLLATPRVAPSRFMRSLKGFTAREANKILKRTGEPFWQHESYDHWVRDGTEFAKIRSYIEQNPVKAGLVNRPQDFPWSSAALSSERTRGASS